MPGRPALQLSAASGSPQEERSLRGWVRVPPALLTVQPGWTGEEPSTASGLRELSGLVSSVCPQRGHAPGSSKPRPPKARPGPRPQRGKGVGGMEELSNLC